VPPVSPPSEALFQQEGLPEATLSPVDLGPLMLENIGQNLEHSLGPAPLSLFEAPEEKKAPPPPEPPAVPPPPPAILERVCSSCGKVYNLDYTDSFCVCGTELVPMSSSVNLPPAPSTVTFPGIPVEVSPPSVPPPAVNESVAEVSPPPLEAPRTQMRGTSERPASGTRCLVLYGPDKKPLRYFPLAKDVTLIGRQDAVRGHFPDIDVSECLDETTARKVSRKHAVLLHSRADDRFILRPLAGNTGTQIEGDMVEALQDYRLESGTRLILGGTVRFKFEVT
jgi:hypothetical protein